MTEKLTVWTIEEARETSRGHLDSCLMHVASSFEKAIEFLKDTLKDDNSGFDEDTIIIISKELVDAYFEEFTVDRKPLKEWISDGTN